MPAVSVSMVCESTAANVTAALRESLSNSSNGGSGGGGSTSCSAAANVVATGNAADEATSSGISSAALLGNGSNGHGSDLDDSDCLQSKLVASAKRVLLSKIDYEEVDNYGQSVLDTLKSKYIILKPNAGNSANNNNTSLTNGSNGNGCTTENKRSFPTASTCSNGNSGGGNSNVHNTANVHSGVNGNSAADFNGKSIIHTTTVVSSSNKNTNSNVSSNASNGNSANTPSARRSNSHELPLPKRVLFPRENVRVGWKNGTRKWQVGVGMMNVGNTCYLNSTLQALFHVPSMANWLVSETQHMERCDDGGCIICAMCRTLLISQTNMAPIPPFSVFSKLRIICKHLIMGRQEDAHEFLRYLVEAMEKSYLSRFHNYKELDQYSKETTPLNQILGGYLKSAVRCLSCNHVSVTFQHFQDLLLDIRKADTVEEALDAYFSRERLEDMGYKCESCKKKVSATKQFTLERAPIVLCIQLKRFSMTGSKLNKHIAIRPRLDISKYLTRKNPNEQYTYKLVSMITHLGASQHCGHYTAIGLTESGAYYNFDDSCVRPIPVQNVCNTNTYIIFYEMDNAPTSLPRTTSQSSTATSSFLVKENNGYQTKNGFSLSVKNGSNNNNNDSNGKSSQAHRLIGPQLPPGGLKNYNSPTSAACNGIKLKNIISNCTSSTTATVTTASSNSSSNSGNSSKILIHFKNGSTAVKSIASSTTTTMSANSTMSSHVEGKGNSSNSSNSTTTTTTTTATTTSCAMLATTNHINGTTNGSGRYRDSPQSKPASPLVKISILNESSCSSEPEDGIISTTDGYSECTVLEAEASSLPSMPNLFDDDEKSKDHCPSVLNSNFSDNSNSNKSNNNKTSLVPYELESDDDNMWNMTTNRKENQSPVPEKSQRSNNINNNNIKNLKRSSSVSLLDTIIDINTDCMKSKRSNTSNSNPNIDASVRSSTQSKAKNKTDNPIDEIFSHNHKALKRKSQSPPQLTLPMSMSDMPSSPINIDYDDCSGDEKYEPNVTPPSTPFMRSYAMTPPSPPLIQTKTGLWQVTSINADSTNDKTAVNNPKKSNDSSLSPVSTSIPPIPLTPPRTWINPFASKSSETKTSNLQNSRPNEKRSPHSGNGYKSGLTIDLTSTGISSTGNTVVAELLQHSHRGYGAPVLTWNGEQTDIEKEIKAESREHRQQDMIDEEENEMDRGRQKKVKHATKDSNYERTPGYNPFQEQDNQRTRWKSHNTNNTNNNSNANSNNPYRYYSSNYRQQPYQRNKSKFQRYNYNKCQRSQQQTNGGNGYNSSNSNHHNSSYHSRRET